MRIGDSIPHYGRLDAIVITGGERYYLFTARTGAVSHMPASMFEDGDSQLTPTDDGGTSRKAPDVSRG